MNRYHLNSSYEAVVIGGSAGSFQGIIRILAQLPINFPVPIILAFHRLKDVRNGFVEALSTRSIGKVVEPDDKEPIKKGIYLAPANYHMSVEAGNYFALSTEEMINNSRPAIDVTLDSAADVFRNKLIGILLSGANQDGGLGMKHIKDNGGITIVQEPGECLIDVMPRAAMAMTQVDHVLTVDQIIDFLKALEEQYK